MTKFKVGDWVVPTDAFQIEKLKIAEPDVTWPAKVSDTETGFSDEWNFVIYKGCATARDSSRFKLWIPEKSLDDYM